MPHQYARKLSARRVADSFVIGLLRTTTWLLLIAAGAIFANLIFKGAPVLWKRGPEFVFGNSVPSTMVQFTDALGHERELADREKRIYDWLIEEPDFQQAFLNSDAAKNPRQLLETYPDIARKLAGFTLLKTTLETASADAVTTSTALAQALDPATDAELIARLQAAAQPLSTNANATLPKQLEVARAQLEPLHQAVHSLDQRLGQKSAAAEEALKRGRELAAEASALRNDILRANDHKLETDPSFSQRSAEISSELQPLVAAAAPANPALQEAWQKATAAVNQLKDVSHDYPVSRAEHQRVEQVHAVENLLKLPEMRAAIEAAIAGRGEAEVSSKATPYAAGSLLGPIIGTVLLVVTCVIIALILGVAAAVYLSEYAHETPSKPPASQVFLVSAVVSLLTLLLIHSFAPLAGWGLKLGIWAGITVVITLLMPLVLHNWVHLVQLAIINLAGVPSIVFGIFGFAMFVIAAPRLTTDPGGSTVLFKLWGDLVVVRGWGTSVMAGAFTLAFMTLPVVIVASEEALKAVPKGFREASLALGGSPWQTIRKAVLPYATPGILTSSVLAITRVAGETAPIMFTAAVASRDLLPWQDGRNGINANPFSWLEQPVMALPYHVYTLSQKLPETQAADQAQFGSVLVFITLVFILTLTSVILRSRLRSKIKW